MVLYPWDTLLVCGAVLSEQRQGDVNATRGGCMNAVNRMDEWMDGWMEDLGRS